MYIGDVGRGDRQSGVQDGGGVEGVVEAWVATVGTFANAIEVCRGQCRVLKRKKLIRDEAVMESSHTVAKQTTQCYIEQRNNIIFHTMHQWWYLFS